MRICMCVPAHFRIVLLSNLVVVYVISVVIPVGTLVDLAGG